MTQVAALHEKPPQGGCPRISWSTKRAIFWPQFHILFVK